MFSRESCPLFTGVFWIFILLFCTGGSALAEGQSGLEQQVRELIEQNRLLQERLKKVEKELSRIKRTGQRVGEYEVAETAGGEQGGFLSGFDNRITFGGLVEFGGAWQEVEKNSGDQQAESDLAMTTVELAIGAEVNPWLNLEAILLYEDPTFDQAESSLDVDVASLTLGNTEEFPFYLSAGRMYVPFGALLTHMPDDPLIDSPLTLTLGDAGEKAVLAGFSYNSLNLSGYTFNGDVNEKGTDDHIDAYGFDLNYSARFPIVLAERLRKGEKYPHGKTTKMDLLAGISYISNIAESDGLTEAVGKEVEDYVAGWATYLHVGCRGVFLDAEYMSAADAFESNELASEGGGAEPSVWNVESGFNYDWGRNLEVVFKFAGSDESGGLGFPEKRYGIGFNQEIFAGVVASLGYLRDFYEDDDVANRDKRDLVFSHFAMEF